MNHTAEKLLTFIKESPTAFQAVEMMKTRFIGEWIYRVKGR